MDIFEAIRDGHALTCEGLAAFCAYVDLEVGDHTISSLLVKELVNVGGENTLAGLDHVRCRIGVYAFQLDGSVIYVGECGTKSRGGDQDLKKRIGQHLAESSGGTLRKNWFKANGCNLQEYKAEIAQCRLWIASFHRGEDTQKIARLEHLLIGILGPKYCDTRTVERNRRVQTT